MKLCCVFHYLCCNVVTLKELVEVSNNLAAGAESLLNCLWDRETAANTPESIDLKAKSIYLVLGDDDGSRR